MRIFRMIIPANFYGWRIDSGIEVMTGSAA